MRHPWDRLNEVGDHVVVPDTTPRDVSLLARYYLERRLGKGVVVAARSTPAGTFVAVAYVPDQPRPYEPGDKAQDLPPVAKPEAAEEEEPAELGEPAQTTDSTYEVE